MQECSIQFTADTAPLTGAIAEVSEMIEKAQAQAEKLESAFRAAGVQASAGLAGGILSGKSSVMNAAAQVAQAAADRMRAVLDIHSPSRVAQKLGALFDQGFEQGLQGGKGEIARAMNTLPLPKALPQQSIAQQMGQEVSRIHLTIPLELDGYRLGIAAQQGIAEVARMSGRQEAGC